MRALLHVLFGVVAPALVAQATIASTTTARATADGRELGEVRSGAHVRTVASTHGWSHVLVEGYVRRDRVGPKRDTFAVTLKSDGDATLIRVAPSGDARVVAVLGSGTGMQRVDAAGGKSWVHLRRALWVTSSSVSKENTVATARGEVAPATGGPGGSSGKKGATPKKVAAAPAPAPVPATPPAAPVPAGTVAAAPVTPDAASADSAIGDFSLAHRATISFAPGEHAVGTLDSAARVEGVARQRGWVKVRAEGWVRDADLVPAPGAAKSITAADLRAEPDRYRNQSVRWVVQVIAFQTADPLRKGLAPDEPYLLARGPGAESSLLYLALPPALVEEGRALPPLATVEIGARVRTGRSEPSGVPLLDVQTLTRRQ